MSEDNPLPFTSETELLAINAKFDAEHPNFAPIVTSDGTKISPRVKSGWNVKNKDRGPLTDKKIAGYEKKGFYDSGFKDARRKLMRQSQSLDALPSQQTTEAHCTDAQDAPASPDKGCPV